MGRLFIEKRALCNSFSAITGRWVCKNQTVYLVIYSDGCALKIIFTKKLNLPKPFAQSIAGIQELYG